ncbi:discoidin domain-containing protein [Actinokineospora auranticolor]|uniref:F5/8 type C domain-containing protein n=1 Tax=Actinokineospora auranticolor TaxID=155976 RepID=A0A2S6GGL7_9PSEU|nr:discoidin domain-containing protein [Actinokineospora auranticolor]PPK64353.1 F5/8 type C domain-containing protein [Actinokineospora auranticolor]
MPSGGRRRRVAVPLVAAALAAAPTAAHAQPSTRPDPFATAQTKGTRVEREISGAGAVARFWADYSAGATGDAIRKSAAIVDARLRAQGTAADPVRRAVRMLAAHATGDHRRAWCERLSLDGARVPAEHAEFVTAALAASDQALGLARPVPVPTAPGAYTDHLAARMADGDTRTFYWSDGAPTTGQQYVLDLGRVRPVERVAVAMGTAQRPLDVLRSGVLEGSVDGVTWTTVRRLTGHATVAADFGAARDLRYLRLRATAGQRHWLAVREITVRPGPADVYTDGDPTTGLRGRAAEVPLGTAEAIDRIVVLAGPDTPAGAKVEVRDQAGGWHTVGRLGGEYTDVEARGAVADGVRVVLPVGQAGVRGVDSTGIDVREIVVRPAE